MVSGSLNFECCITVQQEEDKELDTEHLQQWRLTMQVKLQL